MSNVEKVSCSGRNIEDRHTHYELHTYIGPTPATIEIPGYVSDAFRETYGRDITNFGKLVFCDLDFLRNDQLVKECQNPFRPTSHLKAIVQSIGQINVE